MQIYCNKRKRLHKKRVQLQGDGFGTPTWPPRRHVKTLYIVEPALTATSLQRPLFVRPGGQKINTLTLV